MNRPRGSTAGASSWARMLGHANRRRRRRGSVQQREAVAGGVRDTSCEQHASPGHREHALLRAEHLPLRARIDDLRAMDDEPECAGGRDDPGAGDGASRRTPAVDADPQQRAMPAAHQPRDPDPCSVRRNRDVPAVADRRRCGRRAPHDPEVLVRHRGSGLGDDDCGVARDADGVECAADGLETGDPPAVDVQDERRLVRHHEAQAGVGSEPVALHLMRLAARERRDCHPDEHRCGKVWHLLALRLSRPRRSLSRAGKPGARRSTPSASSSSFTTWLDCAAPPYCSRARANVCLDEPGELERHARTPVPGRARSRGP